MGSLAEAVKAVAGFTRVVGVPDYREDFDQMRVYRVRFAMQPDKREGGGVGRGGVIRQG